MPHRLAASFANQCSVVLESGERCAFAVEGGTAGRCELHSRRPHRRPPKPRTPHEPSRWDEMTVAEQVEAVRALMLAGGSNRSVAKELGTTPNTIAGLRYRHGIPSTHPRATFPPLPEKRRERA